MAGRSQYNCASDGCEPRIPLFPLRYSARPRQAGDDTPCTYANAGLPLELGFTPLPKAQYDLRCIGEGFVYLIDETKGDFFVWKAENDRGQFIELLAKTRTLDEALHNYKEGNKVPYLWARQGSRVHLLLSDTLLTGARLRDIQVNKDGIRDKLATTLDVAAWKEEAPSKNTFPASRIGELVEEYKGADCSYSPWKVNPKYPRADGLLQSMQAVAPQAQIAVAMYDHIALVQDLSGIFHQARQTLEQYTTAPDSNSSSGDTQRFRKKVIAELIGRIYEAAYAESKDLADDPKRVEESIQQEIDEHKWKRERFAANLAVIERAPADRRPGNYQIARQQLDALPKEPIGQRAEVLADGASRYAKHVNEAGRVAFLRTFSDEVNRRHGVVIDHKNDRYLWLRAYTQRNVATDFGCAFLRYDTDNPLSSTSHAVAFASCIEGMIWGPAKAPVGKVDQERTLFDQWWQMPWQSNPILSNMGHDQGFGETVWNNKSDVASDTVGKVLEPLLRFAAIHLLMEQVGVYTLYRAPLEGGGATWHGAARDAVAHRIHQLAGTGSPEDAARLIEILETRYQDRLVTRRLTVQEAEAYLASAQGLPEGTLARGSIARGAGDSMEVLVWERTTPLTRFANPFLQVFNRGVAGGVAVLSLWNLKSAVGSFKWGEGADNRASQSNLAAAVMSTGMAVNGVLVSTRAMMPALYQRASISGMAVRWLAGQWAVRLFGYGGAIADAFTNWFKAWGQYQKGNTDAATYYALAGVGLGLGGVALTAAGGALVGGAGMTSAVSMAGGLLVLPVWGWIVAGVILLGAGLWWLLKGDAAQYTELEFWLNDGSFGLRKPMGREPEEQVTYATLDDENKAYVMACYAPQKVDDDWKVLGFEPTPLYTPGNMGVMTTYSPRLVVQLAYPLAGEIDRLASIHLAGPYPDGTSTQEAKIQVSQESEEQLPSGGTLRTYVVAGLKKDSNASVSLQAAYTPKLLGERLEKTFTFNTADAPFYYR